MNPTSKVLITLLKELRPYMKEASGLIEVVSRGILDDNLIEKILAIIFEKILLVSDETAIRKLSSIKETLLDMRNKEGEERKNESIEASHILQVFG